MRSPGNEYLLLHSVQEISDGNISTDDELMPDPIGGFKDIGQVDKENENRKKLMGIIN